MKTTAQQRGKLIFSLYQVLSKKNEELRWLRKAYSTLKRREKQTNDGQ